MTTPTVSRGTGVTARKESSTPSGAAAPAAQGAVKPVSRREFLYYIWGASMAVLLAQGAGAIIWFALPRFREGEYGGLFTIDATTLPAVGDAPQRNPAGRFWLTNTPDGLMALSMVCTHLGCLFAWVDANGRFECPCHGSKFERNGQYIEGPAPRNLDRFAVTANTPGGPVTNAEGDPVNVGGASSIVVNTGRKIKGSVHG